MRRTGLGHDTRTWLGVDQEPLADDRVVVGAHAVERELER
jgi:hypothetical protein